MRDDGRWRGIALLEVLAAMTILGLAGSALVRYVGESSAAAQRASVREREIERASSLLARLSLARTADIQAREGVSLHDGFEVRIQRIGPRLFHVIVRTQDGRVELLQTHLAPVLVESFHAP